MIFDVAIVGGGAAGVLCAIHLLRTQGVPLRIALVEKVGGPGAGIAYSTRRPEHLLNVTAGRMSAIDADPAHFVRYLATHTRQAVSSDALSATFAERRTYAAYLRATLAHERARSASELQVIHDEIVAIGDDGDLHLAMRSGARLEARCAILALGNWPRALPMPLAGDVSPSSVLQGWDFEAIAALDAADDVLIAGSGLSMVDAVLTLAANRRRGRVHVVSRHALFPLPHAQHGGVPMDVDALSRLPLSQRIAALRKSASEAVARGEPWQWVMDTLRHENARLWQTLSSGEQARFLRHASRYWDIHRHRIPPAAAAVVDSMLQSGRLVRHAGRIASIVPYEGRLRVGIDPADSAAASIVVHRIVNCIGMQKDIERVPDDLVSSLLRRGLVRRGPHGIGLDTDADGALVDARGHADLRLFTLGSVRIGRLWESVAIPELRVQAALLAERLRGA